MVLSTPRCLEKAKSIASKSKFPLSPAHIGLAWSLVLYAVSLVGVLTLDLWWLVSFLTMVSVFKKTYLSYTKNLTPLLFAPHQTGSAISQLLV